MDSIVDESIAPDRRFWLIRDRNSLAPKQDTFVAMGFHAPKIGILGMIISLPLGEHLSIKTVLFLPYIGSGFKIYATSQISICRSP